MTEMSLYLYLLYIAVISTLWEKAKEFDEASLHLQQGWHYNYISASTQRLTCTKIGWVSVWRKRSEGYTFWGL